MPSASLVLSLRPARAAGVNPDIATLAARRRRFLWVCPGCEFAIDAGQYGRHRRACAKRQECAACGGFFPCERRACPAREVVVEISTTWPTLAPRAAILARLGLRARRTAGKWIAWFIHHERPEEVRPRETWLLAFRDAERRRPHVSLRPPDLR